MGLRKHINGIRIISSNSQVNHAQKRCNNLDFMIFGDYGMVDVNTTVNIKEELRDLNL